MFLDFLEKEKESSQIVSTNEFGEEEILDNNDINKKNPLLKDVITQLPSF